MHTAKRNLLKAGPEWQGFSGLNSQVFPERDAECPLKALPLFPLGKWGREHRLCSHLFMVCGHALYKS